MLDTYAWLKFVHVLAAIVAVGFNASYGVWLARVAKSPEHQGHVLRTIKVLDDRFANPAYGLLLITGLSMVFVADIPLSTLWIALGLGLYSLAVLLGIAGYTPTLRKQIAALEAEGPQSHAYQRLAARGRALGMVLAVLVVGIVFLMVTKPTL
ncbi:MAG: DUF2269 family protein [Actinomycetota bacterium]